MSAPFLFRCVWPIHDNVTYRRLIRDAKDDIPTLAAQAHARITGPGRFSIAESIDVPGSGRTTPTVLVFEAPAVQMAARSYWKASA
jgi:hypothetical protein